MLNVLRTGGVAGVIFRDVRAMCGDPSDSGIEYSWRLVAWGIGRSGLCSEFIPHLPDYAMHLCVKYIYEEDPPELGGYEYYAVYYEMCVMNDKFVHMLDVFFAAQKAFRCVLSAMMMDGIDDARLFTLYSAVLSLAERTGEAAAEAARVYQEKAGMLLAAIDTPSSVRVVEEQIHMRKEMIETLGPEAFASMSMRSTSAIQAAVSMFLESAIRSVENCGVMDHFRSIELVKHKIEFNAEVAARANDLIVRTSGGWMWWSEEIHEDLFGLRSDMIDTCTILPRGFETSLNVRAYQRVASMVADYVDETGVELPVAIDSRFVDVAKRGMWDSDIFHSGKRCRYTYP